MDKILREDLEYICRNERDLLGKFDGSTVLITGITGLIGSQIAKTLLYFTQLGQANITVAGIARNRVKAAKKFAGLNVKPHIIYGDICEDITVPFPVDYIIHGANTTVSLEYVKKPVETAKSIVLGSMKMLELAIKHNVKSMVYLSSMESYGVTDTGLAQVTESDIGHIDFLKERSSYSEGKRMAECFCSLYAKEYGVPVKIARLAQVFGADVDADDNRIFVQLAKCAIQNEDMVFRTKGDSWGNYCYTRDAVAAILLLAMDGVDGEAYNVVNETTCVSVLKMAEMVSQKIANGGFKIKFDIPESDLKYGYPPSVKMRLAAQKIAGLGWKCTVGLEEMYRRMIASFLERGVFCTDEQ